ncbi:MAG TPA: dihydrodipicolinate synthase family protein [Candidatus Aminicenantes bacterium]|nr:dihydrodipicolinate synthase family protein [Candidatus Aminicenantes bacterium]
MTEKKKMRGVWSAAPTPLKEDMNVDAGSIERMVEHHLRLGVVGLFLAGTNGEGPWLPEQGLRTLTRSAVRAAAGRMIIAVQVTDNSAARILDNIDRAAKDGADMAVIAPPYFAMSYASSGEREKRIENIYLEAVRRSPLPVGIYDRGTYSSVPVPEGVLARVYREPNVKAVKDSSVMDSHMRIALSARKRRPALSLFCGYEFDCVKYLKAGYDGLLLGGGVFNGFAANLIFDAVAAGKFKEAERLQARMNRLMYTVYGGKKIRTWLSGEKYLLVRMGILKTYRNFTDYPLTRRDKMAIDRILEREKGLLLP